VRGFQVGDVVVDDLLALAGEAQRGFQDRDSAGVEQTAKEQVHLRSCEPRKPLARAGRGYSDSATSFSCFHFLSLSPRVRTPIPRARAVFWRWPLNRRRA